GGDIVMILYSDGHAVLGSAARALTQGPNQVFPMCGKWRRGILITREYAHQVTAKLVCQAGQPGDMLDLHFAMRYIAVLCIGREVSVPGNAHGSQVSGIQFGLEAFAFLGAVIKDRKVRPL